MKPSIKTFEEACAVEGIDPALPEVSNLPEAHRAAIIANYKLIIIAAALNRQANDGQPWRPVYDGSERHYFPYFYRGGESGSGFSFYCSVHDGLVSTVGSRLEYLSEELSDYAGQTFLDLYRDLHVIPAAVTVAEPE